jgi:hypothetical protein
VAGRLAETTPVPVATRLARGVEGAVDVRRALSGQTFVEA